MQRTEWRLSELAARLRINEDLEYLGVGVWTPSAQASPQAMQQAWAGTILMRKKWQPRANMSGLALVAPASSAARADGLLVVRDDSDPINLAIIANDPAAAQDKPQVTLVKWATLARDFVVLVPNALMHGDPANTIPLPALAVNFQDGELQTTKTIGIASFDMATRIVEYFVIEANGRPTTKSTHVLSPPSIFLKGLKQVANHDFDNCC